MTQIEQLNNEIRFTRDYIKQLEMDPLLNEEILEWVRWMLKGLESQIIKRELHGFDATGNRNNFHAFLTCQN